MPNIYPVQSAKLTVGGQHCLIASRGHAQGVSAPSRWSQASGKSLIHRIRIAESRRHGALQLYDGDKLASVNPQAGRVGKVQEDPFGDSAYPMESGIDIESGDEESSLHGDLQDPFDDRNTM